jgi:hypothetical protein
LIHGGCRESSDVYANDWGRIYGCMYVHANKHEIFSSQ